MTNWQSIARTAVSRPQVMVRENPHPKFTAKTGTKAGWTEGTSRAHAFFERPSCFVNQYGKSRTGKRTPSKTRDYQRRAICLKALAGSFWIFGPRSNLEMQRRSDSQYEGRKSSAMSLRQSYPASKNLLRILQLTTEIPCRFSLTAPRLKCSAMMVARRCVPASSLTWGTQTSPYTLPAGKPKSSPRMFMNSDRLDCKRMI